MPFILQTSGLSKKIGSKALVTDVNIHIPKGEIYGFLGPNGAGKTTVMKMITNLWKPTSSVIGSLRKLHKRALRFRDVPYFPICRRHRGNADHESRDDGHQ